MYMRISEIHFLSWSDSPAEDDFPFIIRFYPDYFVLNYSTHNSWGGDSWCFYGVYKDDGANLLLVFESEYVEGGLISMDSPLTFRTIYKFVGSQVEFQSNPLAAFLRNVPHSPTRFYWKDFRPAGI